MTEQVVTTSAPEETTSPVGPTDTTTETTEITPETETPVNVSEESSKDVEWEKRFNKISEAERQNQKFYQDLKSRQAQVDARIKEIEAKEAELDKYLSLRETAKEDPAKVLEAYDLSWEDAVQHQVQKNQEADQPPEIQAINKRLKELEKHSQDTAKSLEESEKQRKEQEEQLKQQQHAHQVQQMTKQLGEYALSQKEKYPHLSVIDEDTLGKTLFDTATQIYNTTGNTVNENEVCEALEKEYAQLASIFSKVNRSETPVAKSPVKESKTLTQQNTRSATTLEDDQNKLPNRTLSKQERYNYAMFGDIEGPK